MTNFTTEAAAQKDIITTIAPEIHQREQLSLLNFKSDLLKKDTERTSPEIQQLEVKIPATAMLMQRQNDHLSSS